MKIESSGDSGCPSPDCSGKPGMKKGSFSCRKRATEGSSFFGIEKQLFERGLGTERWK